ncbi:TetR/AcrR family transcriptional regulator [Microbacterium sp.]|uniref:TetR/AcrR family transcriptional regulator n=1 Tax=Microbacterium sp. TaxID=51671 RepID=UPI001ACA27AF|nr:TetR/AcrR family transcriptional regulator [Microbacterium sp.]MBN9157592.1 TetR family transcriptional regulator [Microbacterium sp.]MBS1898434.1 TetR family transcriptional regulator [Actinomycetota bacterium]MBS1901769.1 TetR family transcriptional regulator [Actinomycetota bacterium]
MQTPTGLMSRRKAATAGEIAEEAARLFAERGVAQVTAAEIAEASGVSLRTFYRYFPTKEDAVAPVLEIGAARWQAALEEAEEDPAAAIPAVLAAQLTPETPEDAEALARMRPLLRALADDRELRAVWHRVNHESEDRLVALIVERGEHDRFAARMLAAAATEAIRIGLEEWSRSKAGVHGSGSPAALASRAYAALAPGR